MDQKYVRKRAMQIPVDVQCGRLKHVTLKFLLITTQRVMECVLGFYIQQ